MNIADLLSRGCSPRQMLSSRWWEGPSWLKQNSEYWPDGEISCELQEVKVERKKTKNANVDLANDAPPLLICNVSDYDKMIRVFAWILRFVNNCRKDYNKCKEHELSVAEIENSEKQLIRLSQTYYLTDVEPLKFVTFIDNDNILRVKSKITERNDESSFLYPILLPDKCEFTKLLIRSIHKLSCRNTNNAISLSLIRERFWIIRARKAIKSILNECFVCARFKVKSLSSGPSPLPPDRVNDCAIFEVVGIDLAGPLFLKTGEKVWITLFTCAVYRALHLELVNALSSDAFLLALRRFIASRGRPRIIYCDNGTNFRGAFNDLPPTAAWWGGWWERLVRIIKELLKRSLGKSISVKSTKPEKVLNINDAIIKKIYFFWKIG
ncbi:integrase catalytic domain-containing protein [Trichonephila clavipes]|nr:integrase catalytic domain-containing protein [Trichonephila clavipes]